MKTPTANKYRQAVHAAAAAGNLEPDRAGHAVGIVDGLHTSPAGLEYLRRAVARDLSDDVAKLAKFAPKPGQTPAAFGAAYRQKEAKVAFLQDLLAAVERAGVTPCPF